MVGHYGEWDAAVLPYGVLILANVSGFVLHILVAS